MGWEWRKHGDRVYGPYFVHKQGERRYIGKSDAASQYAVEEIARRAEQEALRAERKILKILDDQLNAFIDQTDTLMEASLMSAGLKEHRGEWRKPRE